MRIVIDIDENKLWEIKNESIKKNFSIYELASYIDKGVPLPKGHGRLIDADAYRKEILDSREFDFFKRLDMQPTIIEADK